MIDKKVNEAIDVIKLASQMSEQYYNKPIEVAYSGGKDSARFLKNADQMCAKK